MESLNTNNLFYIWENNRPGRVWIENIAAYCRLQRCPEGMSIPQLSDRRGRHRPALCGEAYPHFANGRGSLIVLLVIKEVIF